MSFIGHTDDIVINIVLTGRVVGFITKINTQEFIRRTPMNHIRNCPDEIFGTFWKARGACTNEKNAVTFATETYCNNLQYTDLISIDIPNFNAVILQDWYELEQWLGDMRRGLDIEKVLKPNFDYWEENAPPPSSIVSSFEELKDAALSAISEEDCGYHSVGYTEIENNGRRLFLIYENFEAWSLGHIDSVKVLGSLSELTKNNRYYDVPRSES
jgi:hypothetical protein